MKENAVIEESDNFYNEAVRFYKSGEILSKSEERIGEEIDLFCPIVYLYRHSVELLFKALIIKSLGKRGEENWLGVKLQPCNKKIANIHSILDLFNAVKILDVEISKWTSDEENIVSLIIQIDKYDETSTFFRYPYDKNGNLNRRNMTESVEDLMVGMPCSFGNFIYHEGLEKFSCLHREQELEYLEEDLPYLIERLSDIYLK